MCLPSYRHIAFPTQIFRKLLYLSTRAQLLPNAGRQARPEAGAQRTLEGVACRRLFGQWVTACVPSKAELARTV